MSLLLDILTILPFFLVLPVILVITNEINLWLRYGRPFDSVIGMVLRDKMGKEKFNFSISDIEFALLSLFFKHNLDPDKIKQLECMCHDNLWGNTIRGRIKAKGVEYDRMQWRFLKLKKIDFIAIDINYLHRENKDEEFIAKLIFHEYLHHYLDTQGLKNIDQDKYIAEHYGV